MRTERKMRSWGLPVVVVMLLLVTVLGASTVRTLASAASSEPEVLLVQPEEARAGELIRVKLVARHVQDLAGFQSTVRFNPAEMAVYGGIIEKDLERGGRGMLAFSPVQLEETLALGAVTCPVADCSGNPFVQDQPRVNKGVSGEVVLATMELAVEQPGTYQLRQEDVKLVDPDGNLLDVAVRDLALSVTGGE